MQPELPTTLETANKLVLLKQHLMQIVADPKYQRFKDEILILNDFLSGNGLSLNTVLDALKKMQNPKKPTSP